MSGEIVEKRQVHDLPIIKVQVTEHQTEKKQCPHCKLVRVSKFPKTVEHWVQYGENIKGLVTYLSQYQLIPSTRVQELMREVFGCAIGQGTIEILRLILVSDSPSVKYFCLPSNSCLGNLTLSRH